MATETTRYFAKTKDSFGVFINLSPSLGRATRSEASADKLAWIKENPAYSYADVTLHPQSFTREELKSEALECFHAGADERLGEVLDILDPLMSDGEAIRFYNLMEKIQANKTKQV